MIRCYLFVMIGKKKMNIADVHRATITHLYYETSQRIELHAINKLCSLFECQVGDFFEWIADDEGAETLSVGK